MPAGAPGTRGARRHQNGDSEAPFERCEVQRPYLRVCTKLLSSWRSSVRLTPLGASAELPANANASRRASSSEVEPEAAAAA